MILCRYYQAIVCPWYRVEYALLLQACVPVECGTSGTLPETNLFCLSSNVALSYLWAFPIYLFLSLPNGWIFFSCEPGAWLLLLSQLDAPALATFSTLVPSLVVAWRPFVIPCMICNHGLAPIFFLRMILYCLMTSCTSLSLS